MAHDIVISNVRTHQGTRYGGERQRSLDSAIFASKSKPSISPSRRSPGTIVGSPVNVRKIKWTGRPNGRVEIMDCPRLDGVITRLTPKASAQNAPFYRNLLAAIRNYSLQGMTKFRVVATGTVPERRRELGVFLKVMVMGQEFILPQAFFEECRPALVRNHLLAAKML